MMLFLSLASSNNVYGTFTFSHCFALGSFLSQRNDFKLLVVKYIPRSDFNLLVVKFIL